MFGDEDRVEEEENEELRATYEYFDGHWKPYAEDAHGIVEAAFKDWLADKEVDSRPVKSGEFIYSINFDEWTQQNMQVPPHTVRQIRRCVGGVAQENVPSPKKAKKKPVPAEPEEEPEVEDEEEEEAKPKKRPAKKAAAKPKKRGKKEDEDEDEEEQEDEDKPKKRPATKKVAAKSKAASKSKKQKEEEDNDEEEEEEDKPKKRPAKKAAAKKEPAKKAKGGAGSSVLDGLVFCITGKLSQVSGAPLSAC